MTPASVTERQRDVLRTLVGVRRIEELVSELGGHPNSTRAQLRTLEAKGLVTRESATPQGRGRPAVRYRRTESGDMIVDGALPVTDTMTKLAEVLTGELATQPDAATRARTLGHQWGRQESDSLGAPTTNAEGPHQRLIRLAARLGFAPSDEAGGICLHRCPLLELARRYPQVVCSMHLGVLEGALHGHQVTVGLEAFTQHGCSVTLSAI